MGLLAREIAEQPQAVAAFLDRETAPLRRAFDDLPPFSWVMIAARGSSDHAAIYARYLWGWLGRLAVAPASPSLHTIYRSPPRMDGALVVGVSQSGQSPDVVTVLAEARAQRRPTLAITNDPSSPLARAADHVIALGAEERSIAATKTYTTQLGAVALAGALWSGQPERLDELRRAPEAMARTLALADGAVARAAEALDGATTLVSLARGVNLGTAHEAALKLRELLRVATQPFSAADFRHGSIALLGPGLPVLLVMPSGAALPDMADLARALAAGGARLVAITDEPGAAEAAIALPLAPVPEWLSPLTAILPAQRLALALAAARGLDPDRPQGLAEKVIRTL